MILKIVDNLFEGKYRYWYWGLKNKFFSKPKTLTCTCRLREECRICWTNWQKELNQK
jgi:hypothetical protein